ncbi:MAG TPA: polyphosphate kinase 1 [Verrucomicrobiota bacterium]|nr:polyphosphate kinase 1 [Verrucomicrobiota bacterium]
MRDTSFKPGHFINRELSWLEFNQRVLDEALNPATPLLERLKFLCITSSNLDEFFEVRVAGLKQKIESESHERAADGKNAAETLKAVTARIRRMVKDLYDCWRDDIKPSLADHDIRLLETSELGESDRVWLEELYRTQIRPVLTPLAIDPAHPFPQLLNKSLNMIVQLELARDGQPLRHLAVVQVPRVLPRLLQLPRDNGHRAYVRLGQVIQLHLADIFPGTKILGYWHFRVTRNSELYIDQEETENLLRAVENELHNRRKGAAVRLELDHDCPDTIRKALLRTLNLTDDDLYLINGPLNFSRLMMLCDGDHSADLRYPPFVPVVSPALKDAEDLFQAIRRRDILLHHPYESFSTVVEMLEQAAADPDVLAIKQTLYRTGGDPRIIGALMNAVKNGKQVTAVVELRARFDEANNIQWARKLEENGVHVVYGLVGYKIHSKACLIVRHEEGRICRYAHLATGNYNPSTARLYTDVGLLTCDPDIGEDVTNLFNLLTGICQFQPMRKLVVAPFDLHKRMIEYIERETANAKDGLPARIIAKVNSLAEPMIIEALYRASQAGVKIDLVVRGICCLRPGVRGVSDNITVRSIVGRFLEHSRIFYFENACAPKVFVGSADWLPRNLFRRIETVFPIEDGNLRERVIRELLNVALADNTKARLLQPDASWKPGKPAAREKRRDSQQEFIAIAEAKVNGVEKPVDGKAAYPRVKLMPSPFAKKSRGA